MPDTVRRTEQIWAFGRRHDFRIYDCGVALDPSQYQHAAGVPVRRQKNQIVLHYTAGNGPAGGAVNWWNTIASQTPPKRASAHYVVELAQHRADAAQRYSDVIEVVGSDTVTWHGEIVNANSIGIEHTNVGWDWNVAQHDTFTGAGAAKRPTDQNRWLHLDSPSSPDSNLSHHDFQAYQEEQYLAMILLLRHLSIKHRIPRRFLGHTTAEKLMRWWHGRPALIQSRLMRFRGILSHMNCHAGKECGGPAMHRNRLFRGIIDEWWLPVQFDGSERTYYVGPFAPRPSQPSYFRFVSGTLSAALFHDADLDSLQQTRSYYDFDHLEWYYSQTESTEGGTFPIGTNKVWHGGVHLSPPEANRKVYAAASGTIVAARLGSEAAVERDPQYGSQRFVLIRHCVYTQREPDPGGGTRTNYGADPTYVFTLYMHLAPFANLAAADNNNPPWFNLWLRQRTGATDPNRVFCPDIEVSVGDWLGECGTYQRRRMIHFEVVSREELTVAPWNDARHRIYDDDANLICNAPNISRFIRSRFGNVIVADWGIDTLDILRGARELRRVKSYHKSEWALDGPDALSPVLPLPSSRRAKWEKLRHFMWVADAVAACPALSSQLSDARGLMWHYHPITFLEYVNRLVQEENGEVAEEADLQGTNVVLEEGFLTRYVSFASGAAAPAPADNQRVQPYAISQGGYEYHFTRAELACLIPGAHLQPPAPAAPPTETRFHIALLDVLENARVAFGQSVRVHLSHVCPSHGMGQNRAYCVLGTDVALERHSAGYAVDIRPSAPTPARCRDLWLAARSAASAFRSTCVEQGGEPSQAELIHGVEDVTVSTEQALEDKLQAGTALTTAEANRFILHMELIMRQLRVEWYCWIRRSSRATTVRIYNGAILGAYATRADAEAERVWLTTVWPQGTQWECRVRRQTQARSVSLLGGGIVAAFDTLARAEDEREQGTGAWPREV